MMDWMLISGLGTAALLLIEAHDFIRDRWLPRAMPPSVLPPVVTPAPSPVSTIRRAAGAESTGNRWQSAARRLADQWTLMDGVMAQHEALLVHCQASGRDARAAAAVARTARPRTLSPDQILSLRINAAYAVWAAARASQL